MIRKVKLAKNEPLKTLIITDERCLEHAGFENYHQVANRVRHKSDQPENAERLMVLINKDRGVLQATEEFSKDINVLFKQSIKEVALADVFRVHDYNYLMKVIELC